LESASNASANASPARCEATAQKRIHGRPSPHKNKPVAKCYRLLTVRRKKHDAVFAPAGDKKGAPSRAADTKKKSLIHMGSGSEFASAPAMDVNGETEGAAGRPADVRGVIPAKPPALPSAN